ncbi:hypothetical protein NicSoilB8_37130 [Arthrobacter sp. NicSoilB8]|nr:hypothetical protein NicSoilB8_37130 [Arthrobacter sp. NicSoilB8]
MFRTRALVPLFRDVVRDQQVGGGQVVGGQPVGTFDGGAQVRPHGLFDGVGDFLEAGQHRPGAVGGPPQPDHAKTDPRHVARGEVIEVGGVRVLIGLAVPVFGGVLQPGLGVLLRAHLLALDEPDVGGRAGPAERPFGPAGTRRDLPVAQELGRSARGEDGGQCADQ